MKHGIDDHKGRSITLSAVDDGNWREIADVAPRDDQRDHVAALAARYLLLSAREGEWTSLGVLADGRIVGHVMWGHDEEDGAHWIGGLVIDAREQGSGVGSAAMRTLLRELSARPDCREVRLSYGLGNTAAARLYAALGFVAAGEPEGVEIVVAYDPRAARVREAARNNAEWCDTLCRTHGVRGKFTAAAWTSAGRTPPFYPDAVTLVPGVSAADVLAGVDLVNAGCTVKDSFADLDLSGDGFEVLFDAGWIRREAAQPAPAAPEGVRWGTVRTTGELAVWERAWDGGVEDLFRPGLLDDAATLVLAGRTDERVVAGAVLTPGAGVVGVSNLFAVDGDLDAAWAGCLSEAARHRPETAVVGYEHGTALEAALRHGFTVVGPLRIWLHTG